MRKQWDHSKLPDHIDLFLCPSCKTEFSVNFYKGEKKVCPCGNTEGMDWLMKKTLNLMKESVESKNESTD